MRRIFGKLRRTIRWFNERKGYFIAKTFGVNVPPFPLAFVPDGFSVMHAGNTGLSICENFCTAEEAHYLIRSARDRLEASRITIGKSSFVDDYRTSQTAMVFDPSNRDPQILPLLFRASMLLGLPYSNIETVFVTRYQEGEYYKAHEDFYEGFDGDRLYTVLIYLNDLADNQGGGTVFEKLNLGVKPKLGRAVIWTNTNPDDSHHPETRHEAMPVENGGEKWVVQLWYRNYKMIGVPASAIAAPQTRKGEPLKGDEPLPPGAWAPGEVAADSPYGKAFAP